MGLVHDESLHESLKMLWTKVLQAIATSMQTVFLRGQVIYLPSLHLIPVCTSVQGVSQLVLIRTMSTCMTGTI